MEIILAEGLENRWARHREMAERTRAWALQKGWSMFPAEGFWSDTVSCIACADGPDFNPAIAKLAEEGLIVSGGYGKLKGETFRIGHMGEHSLDDLEHLLGRFDAALGLKEDATR